MNQSLAKPKAYSYVRYSSPEQAKGDSLRRQIDMARAYADKHGLELDESMKDLGLSAFRGLHRIKGALGSFLSKVEKGEIAKGSMLIVESLDRLSREDVFDALVQLASLIKSGISVVTLTDERCFNEESIRSDWTQLIFSLVIMSRAREESERKSDRVSRAQDAKRQRAAETREAGTARCVAWCTVEGEGRNRRYVLIPERAAVIRRIFEMCLEGMGQYRIVRALNREGLPTWGCGKRKGNQWNASYVVKILHNRAVCGYGEPHKKINGLRQRVGAEIPGYYPAVVSEDVFLLAKAARDRRKEKGGPRGEGVANLFQGLIRCGSCGCKMGNRMRGNTPKGGRWLVCRSANQGARCGNPKPNWFYNSLEDQLLKLISEINWSELAGGDTEREKLEADLERHRLRQAAINAEIDALLENFGADATVPQVKAKILSLHKEAESVTAAFRAGEEKLAVRRAQSSTDAMDIYNKCIAEMKSGDPEQRMEVRTRLAEVIRKIVARIELTGENIKVFDLNGNAIHHLFPVAELVRLKASILARRKAPRDGNGRYIKEDATAHIRLDGD